VLRCEAVKRWRAGMLGVLAVSVALARNAHAQVTPAQQEQIVRELAAGQLAQGLAFEQQGRLLEAEGMLQRATQTDRGNLTAALAHARVLLALGRATDARRVLSDVTERALRDDADRIALARARSGVNDHDGALRVLSVRAAEPALLRARIEIATRAGQFLLALADARRWMVHTRGTEEETTARTTVRALEVLAGTLDAVTQPGQAGMSSPVRRALVRAR